MPMNLEYVVGCYAAFVVAVAAHLAFSHIKRARAQAALRALRERKRA